MFSLGGALSAAPYVVLTFAAMLAYDRMVDDPAVAAKARQGYVQESESAALRAQVAELKRQRDAAEKAAAQWAEQLERQQLVEDAQEREREAERADLAARLASGGRSCPIGPDELKWLQRR